MKYFLIALCLVGTFSYGQRSDFATIEFDMADSIALKYKGASLKNLPFLVHKLTSNLSADVEKFRAIYTWVCTNIENDYGSYQKTIKKRKKLSKDPEALSEWNANFTQKVFKKLVNQRKTACTGYAFLIRELCTLADINCKIINGYGRTATLQLDSNSIPNHSWNAVELNGKWYLCDPTWSAGKIILEEEGPRFEPDYFDGYFLADPNLFVKNHFPLALDWALTRVVPTFNSFIEGPVVYKEAFTRTIIPTAPKEMFLEILKNEEISFILNSTKKLNVDYISLILSNSNTSKPVRPKITRNQNYYLLKYKFEKSGKYDVHIKVEDTIITTYVIRVKRR